MAHPAPRDTSGIKFPPPAIYAGLFAVGYAVHYFVPARLATDPPAALRVAGWVLAVVGALLAVSSVVVFRRAGTTPHPAKPTTALVVHGPYRLSRNPIYLGFAGVYLGATLLVNSLWPLALFPVVIAIVQTQVIAREEGYLAGRFGDEYRAYRARVRRWI